MFREFEVTLPVIPEHSYDIRSFGAQAGGKTSNTAAFAKAIEAASQTGGRVNVPNGIWKTGPITLRSNVELHLEDNAVILFDKTREEYPLVITDFEGIRRIRTVSPINAEHAENIAITGNGTINGNGHLWRPVKQFKMTQRQWDALLKQAPYVIEGREGGIWVPSQTIYEGRCQGEVYPDNEDSDETALARASAFYDFYRPVMVSLRYCRKVVIEGVHLQNSPAWNVHPYFCDDLTVRNVSINNPFHAQNGDGIDIDSCNRVHIHHCDLETGDDGICLKSGKDKAARALKKPCENILIHDCKVGRSHGGFVIGSEMSRGVRNVLVKDCTFIDSNTGVNFKSAVGRGGIVENIVLQDIQMINIRNHAVILSMDYVHNQMDTFDPVSDSKDPEDIPEFRNVEFVRCICEGGDDHAEIRPLQGYPDSIHDIRFSDCQMEVQNGTLP